MEFLFQSNWSSNLNLFFSWQTFQVRTQRKMDERVQRNIVELKKQEEELKNVSINKEIVKSIPEDTAEVYKCILTQASWTDLVCDDPQSRDVVGFGLAVELNECTILLLLLFL
jgi:recombinational DNA repair ATPase RecF